MDTHFDAKREDSDDGLEDEREGEFPQCGVDPRTSQRTVLERVRRGQVAVVITENIRRLP